MRRGRLFHSACLALGLASSVSLWGQATQTIAHVLEVKGNWRLDGRSGSVTGGDALIAGARLTVESKAGDSITIVHDEDLSRQRIVCDGSASNPCRSPIVVQAASSGTVASGSSQFKGIVQAAISLLLDKPPAIASHYALTLTRGAQNTIEAEDVVAFDTAGVLLPQAPASLPAGAYLTSISLAGQDSTAKEQINVLSSEGSWKRVQIAAPGLYAVTFINADQEQVGDLMLLVVPASEYVGKRQAFDAMKSRTATWTGPSARADEHLFLRAFLLSASRPS